MDTVFCVELLLPAVDPDPEINISSMIKEIAAAIPLLDYHPPLLFISAENDLQEADAILQSSGIRYELGTWLELDERWITELRVLTDYGVATPSGRTFIDLTLCAVMQLTCTEAGSELASAILQAEEHAIAMKREDGRQLLAVDRQQIELLEGIARAYRCSTKRLI
ncbi:hypothetical protein [Paenibacillus spongiae]|uniref:Uncharacterized protein n=1 Tax=Paenibacillus spongiae TaxID=2909671 RepID=A0ABY5SI53_9BACL|nr:hypothetical protein [Paenibacillus spongiae]UVI32175.1 hypothetical protein L1F29_10305 [Paenibacillus spongiae]